MWTCIHQPEDSALKAKSPKVDCLQDHAHHPQVRTLRLSRASTAFAWAMHRGVHSVGRWLTALAELNFRRRHAEEEDDDIMALEKLAASPAKQPDPTTSCVHMLTAWFGCLTDSCRGCECCKHPAGPVAEGRGARGGARELGAVSGTFDAFLGIDDVAAGLAAAAETESSVFAAPSLMSPNLGRWSWQSGGVSAIGNPLPAEEFRPNPFEVPRRTGGSGAAVSTAPPQPPSRWLPGLTLSPAQAVRRSKPGRGDICAESGHKRTNPPADPLASSASTSADSSPRVIPTHTTTPTPVPRQTPRTTPLRPAPPGLHPDLRTPLPNPRPGSSSGCSPASHICRARLASLHHLSRGSSRRCDRPPARSHSLSSMALQLPATVADWCGPVCTCMHEIMQTSWNESCAHATIKVRKICS